MHYRELTVWQKAMEVPKEVYRLASRLPHEEAYGMRSQITRAAASVPANIAGGWARESGKETAPFLAIVQGSLADTETILTLCEQIGRFSEAETKSLRALVNEVGSTLTAPRSNFRDNRKTPNS